MAHLSGSLDALVSDLNARKPFYPYNILKQSNICLDEDGCFDKTRFEILKNGKSKLPYDILDVKNYIKPRTKPPDRKEYYSKLKEAECDEQTYSDIQKFWTAFSCDSLGILFLKIS